jgi:hypothetical protein
VAGVSQETRHLLNYLAREGRSSKSDIERALGWYDRKIRKHVELARRAGIPVMSSSGATPGYWLSTDICEVEEFIAHEIESRMASLESQRQRLRETVSTLADAI